MASGHAYQRAFSTACKRWMQISSAYRKQKSKQGKLSWMSRRLQITINIGTMRSARGIPARRSSPRRNRAPCSLGSASRITTQKGRVITLEFDAFYLVTVYTPNAQEELARIDYRMDWENAFRAHLQKLDAQKPVVFCGDLNVAHQEIDLKNPKPNRGKAGFSDEERGKFSELLAAGFTDTFRYLYPDLTGAYSWWSYRFQCQGEKRRLAHRLFLRFQPHSQPNQGGQNPHGNLWFRPLPGGIMP